MRRGGATYRRRSGLAGVLRRTVGRLRIRRLLRRRVKVASGTSRPYGTGGPELGEGGAGVREPRVPLPTAGSGAAAVPVDPGTGD